jgi:hypothetical protein
MSCLSYFDIQNVCGRSHTDLMQYVQWKQTQQQMYLLWFGLLQNNCFSILPHFLLNFLECFVLHNLPPVFWPLMVTKPILPACRCVLVLHTSIQYTLLHRLSWKSLGCVLCSMWHATNGTVYLNGMCVLENEQQCSQHLELLTGHP